MGDKNSQQAIKGSCPERFHFSHQRGETGEEVRGASMVSKKSQQAIDLAALDLWLTSQSHMTCDSQVMSADARWFDSQ
jgi:hypothetical protein